VEGRPAEDERDAVLGERGLIESPFPSMNAEDFAYYLERPPGCYVRFGARAPGQEPVPLHNPSFDVDERVLAVGARWFHRLAHRASEAVAGGASG